MENYKALYYKLFCAVTDSLNALTHAQLECEAAVMEMPDPQDETL